MFRDLPRRFLIAILLPVTVPLAARSVQNAGSTGSATPGPTQATPRVLGGVAVSDLFVAFSYAGDLWITPRAGGEARQLTSGPAEDDYPAFSPDGAQLAFSRRGADDWDVYVIPPQGGEARRLTWNPELDIVRGWSPDGARILFMSHRDAALQFRLYTIPLRGVFPTPLRLPRGYNASFGPNGDRIAYEPVGFPLELLGSDWNHYRGGLATGIRILRLGEGTEQRLPAQDSHDRTPMWAGRTIYFLSDRSGVMNLHSYDLDAHQTRQLTDYERYGIESASLGAGVIAFTRDGAISIYDPRTGETTPVEIRVQPDTSARASRVVKVAETLESVDLSSGADTILVGGRGEALLWDRVADTVINLTGTSGVAERHPRISPDGRSVAYFSDESGEYQLHVRRLEGTAITKIPIELRPSLYHEPVWSNDSRKLAFTDRRLALWIADVETGGARRVTSSSYPFQTDYQPVWSPDGRWLAYRRYESSGVRRIYAYDLTTGQSVPITDGRADAESSAFDPTGRYFYFTASNNGALTAGTEDVRWDALSTRLVRPLVTRRLYVATVRPGLPAPVYPVTGDPRPEAFQPGLPDTVTAETEREEPPLRPPTRRLGDTPLPRRIGRRDREGPPPRPERRVAPLPLVERNYEEITALRPGVLLVTALEWAESPVPAGSPSRPLYLYNLRRPKAALRLLDHVDQIRVAPDGGTVLYRLGQEWFVRPITDSLVTAAQEIEPRNGGAALWAGEPGAEALELTGLEIEVDPAAEWRQIHREAWRIARHNFYDPGYHGQNLTELERHYEAYLPGITRRDDLNRLIARMLGHLSVSHLSVRGGDLLEPPGDDSRIGLLGADFQIERERYRITKIYRSGPIGESSPLLQSPLDQPGIDVQPGEYLLTVEGDTVRADRNLYSYFEGTAGKRVRITVAPEPDGEGARGFTVVPLSGENTLRRIHWAEQNREHVDERTGGKIGYVYVPNFGASGIERFFRDLAAVRDRQGLIVDTRFNVGGTTADYLANWLKRDPLYYYTFREGNDLAVPVHALRGPRILMINELAFSAAETFAFMFKLRLTGTVIGVRTAGAGIGPSTPTPPFIDGGTLTIPDRAAYNPTNGTWDIENSGIEPDIEVEWRVEDWRNGVDTQLKEAIERALIRLSEDPPPEPQRPEPPRYP